MVSTRSNVVEEGVDKLETLLPDVARGNAGVLGRTTGRSERSWRSEARNDADEAPAEHAAGGDRAPLDTLLTITDRLSVAGAVRNVVVRERRPCAAAHDHLRHEGAFRYRHRTWLHSMARNEALHLIPTRRTDRRRRHRPKGTIMKVHRQAGARLRRGVAAALSAIGLLTAACGGGNTGDDTANLPQASAKSYAGSTTTSAATTPTTTTTSSGVPTSSSGATGAATLKETKATGLPKSGMYSDAEFRVTGATISNAKPDFLGKPTASIVPEQYIYVSITAINKLTNQSVSFNDRSSQALFALISPDGSPVQDTVTTVDELEAAGSADFVAVFPVKSAPTSFTGFKLLVGFPGQAKTTIPLDSDAPALGYPIDLALTGSGPAQSVATGCRQKLDVSVLSTAVDVDLGEAKPASTAKPFHGRRVEANTRYLRFVVRVLNNGGDSCGGGQTNIDDNDFKLAVDGVPKSADSLLITARDGSISLIDNGAAKEFVIAWAVPVSAKSVEFRAGNASKTLFTLPVTLPINLPKLAGE